MGSTYILEHCYTCEREQNFEAFENTLICSVCGAEKPYKQNGKPVPEPAKGANGTNEPGPRDTAKPVKEKHMPKTNTKIKRVHLDEKTKLEIVAKHATGSTYPELAKLYGIGQSTVFKICKARSNVARKGSGKAKVSVEAHGPTQTPEDIESLLRQLVDKLVALKVEVVVEERLKEIKYNVSKALGEYPKGSL